MKHEPTPNQGHQKHTTDSKEEPTLPPTGVGHETSQAMAQVTDKLTTMSQWERYYNPMGIERPQTNYRATYKIPHHGGAYSVVPKFDGGFFHSGHTGVYEASPFGGDEHRPASQNWNSYRIGISQQTALQRSSYGGVVGVNESGRVTIYRLNDLEWERESFQASNTYLAAVRVLPNRDIMTAGDDGILRIFRIEKDGEVTFDELPKTGSIRCFEALPDGRIVTGTDDGRLRLWHKNSVGEWRCDETDGHKGAINSLKALGNGSLVTGGDDSIVKEWHVNQYGIQHLRNLEGHTDAVKSVDMLPDGTILSGSSDKTIRLWREKPISFLSKMMGTTKTSQSTCEVLKGHDSWVMCATFMRDGAIISGSLDGTVRIWKGKSR